jgi:hypothetical protein
MLDTLALVGGIISAIASIPTLIRESRAGLYELRRWWRKLRRRKHSKSR